MFFCSEGAGRRTLEFVQPQVPDPRTGRLSGNSSGTHRRFLARYLPEIEDHLHYRSVDVSTIKELGRRWYPELLKNRPEKEGRHRALDDIRESVAELRFYRDTLFRERPQA